MTDITSILETIQSFYTNLFTSANISPEKIEKAVSEINSSLSEEEKACCDAPITLSEVQQAINILSLNKSPGQDGITSEFYRKFNNKISNILLKICNQMEKTRCTLKTFSQGVIITIVYKNKGDKLNLENYRPISYMRKY